MERGSEVLSGVRTEDVYLVRCAKVGDVVGADVVSECFEASVVSRAWCEDCCEGGLTLAGGEPG